MTIKKIIARVVAPMYVLSLTLVFGAAANYKGVKKYPREMPISSKKRRLEA